MFLTWRRQFGYRWREQADDPHSRDVWLAGLRALRLTDGQVRTGLQRTAGHEWPPSLGEFARVCRHIDCPSMLDGYTEALRWHRSDKPAAEWDWSHPIIACAALTVGSWHWRTLDDRDLRKQWASAYQSALARAQAGDDLTVRPALPSPEQIRVTTAEGRARGLADLVRSAAASIGWRAR